MYPTAQERCVIEAAEKIMVDTMARYDPSHDKYHVQRVRKTALALAHAIPGKVDLLSVELGMAILSMKYPTAKYNEILEAALLHDVLDKKYVTKEEAADPYGFFLPFFSSMATNHGIDLIQDGRAKLITQIIDNVSWSTEKKLRTQGEWTTWHDECLELHCVQDADRLDAIGAFGIMRCAAYSTVTNHALHTAPDDPEQKNSAIQHFYDKLIHIRDRLKTEPGRKIGDKRHQVLLDFLASIDEEFNYPHLEPSNPRS